MPTSAAADSTFRGWAVTALKRRSIRRSAAPPPPPPVPPGSGSGLYSCFTLGPAGGPLALVDGLRGDANWRTGGWLGFQYTDFSATVDLGKRLPVRLAGASFLQDQRSWIWMPSAVIVSVSDDGERFRPVAQLSSDVPAHAPGVILRNMVAQLDGVVARYVRIHAKNFGTIPDWHLGRGDGAFIFVDEILID